MNSRVFVSPLSVVVPAAVPVALMLVWAVDNGGFDATTWYWGALVLLATLAAFLVAGRRRGLLLSRWNPLR